MGRMAGNIGITIALLFSLLLVSCDGESQNSIDYNKMQEIEWTWIPYDSDAMRITGRGDSKGNFVVLMWSGSAVTVGFVGVSLEAFVWSDETAYLDVFVDGEEHPSSVIKLALLEEIPTTVPVITDLPYGPHVVTLYKRTESRFGDWHFYGVRVLGQPDKSLLPAPLEHRIEFVGNSITCGSDALVPVPGMPFNVDYQDSYYGYAGQTARILGAEAHIICSSGRGIYINNEGTKEGLLPEVYALTGTRSPLAIAWDHSRWHPDVIVMNLGTNDFASGQNDSASFVNATVDFVQRLRSLHPDAKIVILDGPMLGGTFMARCRRYLDRAKEILEGMGLTDLYRFSFDPKGEAPAELNRHPTKDEAIIDAESLSAWMRSEFGWN